EVPSLYRYCMLRRSTFAVSTLTPALKVLVTTLPEVTPLIFVRTNAGPLPGLTCWNSTTDQSCPSMLSTMPFFRSLVVATGFLLLGSGGAQCSCRTVPLSAALRVSPAAPPTLPGRPTLPTGRRPVCPRGSVPRHLRPELLAGWRTGRAP